MEKYIYPIIDVETEFRKNSFYGNSTTITSKKFLFDSHLQANNSGRILLQRGKELFPINIRDVKLAFSENRYRFIFANNKTIDVNYSVTELEKLLSPFLFRINRDTIISPESIEKIFVESSAKISLMIKYPTSVKIVKVSRRKCLAFKYWLENLP
jgi:DNA-binding LytR/AlgR family response regulator